MAKDSKLTHNSAPVPAITIGLDLSDRFITYCTLDAQGNVTSRGHFALTRAALGKHFEDVPTARVVLETGAQAAWVSEALAQMGHEVVVANAASVHSIAGSSRKSDTRDAEQLARLGRLDKNLLDPITFRRLDYRLHMLLIRSRDLLIASRTRLINGARAMAKEFGERVPACATKGFAARAKKSLSTVLAGTLETLLREIETISAAIAECDRRVEELNQQLSAETAWLTQIPGVGALTAVTFVLTLDHPERFRHSRDVGAYLGLVPRRSQSGTRDPQLGISKCGDRYLRKLLVQCAHHVLGRYGPDTELRQWGLRYAQSGLRAKKKAVVAVARKLAVLLHRLWQDRATYHPFPTALINARCA